MTSPVKHGRTDGNQAPIVSALREIGATVVILSDIGNGCPDLLVGYNGITLLLEVKDGSKPPSKKKLTPAEQMFFDAWRGGILTITYSPHDAVSIVTRLTADDDDDGIPF